MPILTEPPSTPPNRPAVIPVESDERHRKCRAGLLVGGSRAGGMRAGHICGVDRRVTISESREKVVFQ